MVLIQSPQLFAISLRNDSFPDINSGCKAWTSLTATEHSWGRLFICKLHLIRVLERRGGQIKNWTRRNSGEILSGALRLICAASCHLPCPHCSSALYKMWVMGRIVNPCNLWSHSLWMKSGSDQMCLTPTAAESWGSVIEHRRTRPNAVGGNQCLSTKNLYTA